MTAWFLASAFLVILELMTGTFYMLVLAAGAAAGGALAYLGFGLEMQILAASVVAALGYVVLRKVYPEPDRVAAERNPDIHSEIGSIVRIQSMGADGSLSVSYRGANWAARMDGDHVAEMGRDYVVSRVDGSVLYLMSVT